MKYMLLCLLINTGCTLASTKRQFNVYETKIKQLETIIIIKNHKLKQQDKQIYIIKTQLKKLSPSVKKTVSGYIDVCIVEENQINNEKTIKLVELCYKVKQ